MKISNASLFILSAALLGCGGDKGGSAPGTPGTPGPSLSGTSDLTLSSLQGNWAAPISPTCGVVSSFVKLNVQREIVCYAGKTANVQISHATITTIAENRINLTKSESSCGDRNNDSSFMGGFFINGALHCPTLQTFQDTSLSITLKKIGTPPVTSTKVKYGCFNEDGSFVENLTYARSGVQFIDIASLIH